MFRVAGPLIIPGDQIKITKAAALISELSPKNERRIVSLSKRLIMIRWAIRQGHRCQRAQHITGCSCLPPRGVGAGRLYQSICAYSEKLKVSKEQLPELVFHYSKSPD